MDFLFFLLTLVHVLAGMIFVGLPVLVCAELWMNGGRSWPICRVALQQSLLVGVFALAVGLFIAGFQWDGSFEQAWQVVGSRWIFGFIEFAFSAGLIAAVVHFCPAWPEQRWRRIAAIAVLFLGATNAWYHFPALMVVSREIRLHPELVAGLEGSVVRKLLFSPEILWRWLHIAIASVMLGGTWLRFLIGFSIDQESTPGRRPDAAELDAWQSTDRLLRQAIWLSLLGLWLSGLMIVLQLSAASLTSTLALGSGRSNNLMVGILAANVAAIKTLMPETRPTGLGRFVEFGLMILALTAMLSR
ncbi:MAG: hypothetical protein Q8M16_19200 [Pirellulaceae bacterium]|nr:hypothetical protein [Pirellulaceae bacterium]